MNMQDPEDDPRTLNSDGSVEDDPRTLNSDGSVTNRQARYGVYTSSRYHSDGIVKDHSVLASATQYPNDWKNVKMTGQVRFNSGGNDGMEAVRQRWKAYKRRVARRLRRGCMQRITQTAKLDGQRNIWWQKVCENIDKGATDLLFKSLCEEILLLLLGGTTETISTLRTGTWQTNEREGY